MQVHLTPADGATPSPALDAWLLMGQFLQRALLRPLSADEVIELLPLLSELPVGPLNPDMVRGADLLARFGDEASRLPASDVALTLRQDYQQLFEGPGPVAAPPWESVYRSSERTLFGPTTLQVRAAYQRWGLGVANRGREPEDHIGYELSFLLILTERAPHDPEAAAERRRFIHEHLLRWVPAFALVLEEQAETLFFQGIARLLLGYVQAQG